MLTNYNLRIVFLLLLTVAETSSSFKSKRWISGGNLLEAER
jgi:hypothetical protein